MVNQQSQRDYLTGLKSTGSTGQKQWANQNLYLDNLRTTGTAGQQAWANQQLKQQYGNSYNKVYGQPQNSITKPNTVGSTGVKPNNSITQTQNKPSLLNGNGIQPIQTQQPTFNIPSIKANTKDGNAWFIDGTGGGKQITQDNILSQGANLQLSYNNALKNNYTGLANNYKTELDNYITQLKEQGVDLSQYGDLSQYSRFNEQERGFVGLGSDYNSAYREGQYGSLADLVRNSTSGIGNDIDLTFSNWDSYDDVMSQLNASSTAVAQLSKNNGVTKDQIKEVYDHYLKTHARATELGFGGAVAPLYQTGFVNPDDERYNGFSSAFDRGFETHSSIQDQFAQYLGQLGTKEGSIKNQAQQTLDYLTKLDAVQQANGSVYDFNDALGSNVANHDMMRYIRQMQDLGLISQDANPYGDPSVMIRELLGNTNLGLKVNEVSKSGIGAYDNWKVDASRYAGAPTNNNQADMNAYQNYLSTLFNGGSNASSPITSSPSSPSAPAPTLPTTPTTNNQNTYTPGLSSGVEGYTDNQVIQNELFQRYLKEVYGGGF